MKKITCRGFIATFLAVSASLLLIVSGAVLYWLYDQYSTRKKTSASAFISPPTPTYAPSPTISLPTPTPDREEIIRQVHQSLLEKNESFPPGLKVFLSRTTTGYASGSYQTTEPLESGWWLAANQGEGWLVVVSGQANILCRYLDGYDFPVSIVPECYDETSGNVIDRATEITVITGAVPEGSAEAGE